MSSSKDPLGWVSEKPSPPQPIRKKGHKNEPRCFRPDAPDCFDMVEKRGCVVPRAEGAKECCPPNRASYSFLTLYMEKPDDFREQPRSTHEKQGDPAKQLPAAYVPTNSLTRPQRML